MKQRTFLRITAFMAVGLMLLTACGTEPTPTPQPTATTPPAAQPTTAQATTAPTSKEPIRVGVLATLTGAFAQLGQDGVDGVKLAFDEIGNQINGRPIELYVEGTDASASMALDKARALVNRDKVQLILGPLSGAEGQAIKDNADEWPNTTIIVAGAAAEDITMRGIKPNVWRTSYTGAQPMFALGDWAYKEAGYKKVAIIAEDYAFPYAQVGGFMSTFCHDGGQVVKKFWVPIGTSDYSSIFPQIPKDVDALFVTLGGTDAVNFVNQMSDYGQLGKKPILGGTVTVDASQLASIGDKLNGVVSGSIMSGDIDTPEFKKLDAAFEKLRQRPPSLFVENYYRGAKFGILALQATNGNIEDQASFRTALQNVSFDAPASHVSFDKYHNVVTDTFLNQVKNINGEWRNSVIKTYPQVSQFWTFDPEEYQKQPPYDRDNPACTSGGSTVVTPAAPPPSSNEPIRIGVLATLTGAFAQLGQDGVDGVKLAFDEIGNQINGRPIQLFVEGTDASASMALDKARALVNRDKVQLILGPLSGAEGQAIKDNADEWPNTTIIVAGAAAEDITMRGIKPNVWRTSYTGAQPMFALGDWAYKDAGYKKVAIVAEDYAFPYAQVGGFMSTFCSAGGHVLKKFWVPIGTSDYSSIFPQIPKDIDALYVTLGGTDAVNFVNQMSDYGQLGKKPLLGGTVTVDASQLASVGDKLNGVVSGSIMSGDIDTPEFKKLDAAFEKLRQRPPSLFVENYYRGAKFGILALQAVNGNIEDQAAYRTALQKVEFDAPASHVKFDAFHNVVTDTFLNQVKNINGEWRNSVIKTYPQVSQFWTFDPVQYQKDPPYDRDHPDCP